MNEMGHGKKGRDSKGDVVGADAPSNVEMIMIVCNGLLVLFPLLAVG